MQYRPMLVAILDGWGIRKESTDNAIRLAKTPNILRLSRQFPSTILQASGEPVGLPEGLMGNSEVGHLNLGAGRIVPQDIVRISRAVRNGSFFQNQVFRDAFAYAEKREGKVHILGLVSDGGVHSSLDHLLALIELSHRGKFKKLSIHAFLDGRDTPPQSAVSYLQTVEKHLKKTSAGKIATISGRYYAMDRDKRWKRVEKAYRAIVLGEGLRAGSAEEGVLQGYARGETDEFLSPTVIEKDGKIEDGDSVIFFNFRPDRARELTTALTSENFSGFRLPQPKIFFCSMTEYDASFSIPAAFPKENLNHTLSEVWSHHRLRQFHTAETEKYAHVTYFFGGGREEAFPGEDRLLVPSPKVATYDAKPEMAAREITQNCLSRISGDAYDCIVMNFANADMVGHTGNLEATILGVEVVDECIGKLAEAILSRGGLLVITADHGNAEIMRNGALNQPHTAHTTSPVPFIPAGKGLEKFRLHKKGILADVAPTILEVQGLPVPPEMTGRGLLY